MLVLKNNINIILIFILLLLSALSYHPSFVNLADNNTGSPFSIYITGITVFLFAINFNEPWTRSRFFVKSIVLFLFAVIIGLFVIGFFNSYYENDLRNIAIALAITFIGYNSNLSLRNILIISFAYYILILAVTWSQVQTNIGGFIILDQYAAFAKNSLGVLSSVATIGTFILSFSVRGQAKRILLLSVFFVLFFLILTIRARASTIAVFIICCFYLIKRYPPHSKKVINTLLIITILLFVLAFSGALHYIENFVYNSFVLHNEDDFSNERIDRAADAWEMFIQNPLWGIMDVKPASIGFTYVHNYMLRILAYYGIIGGSFFISIYIFQSYHIIKHCFKQNSHDIRFIGYWITLSLLFSSLAEPTFPYGPGTAVLGAYLSLGFSIKLTEGNSIY